MDDAYINLLNDYNKEEIFEFLVNISRVIEKFNIKLNQKQRKAIIESESDDDCN